MRMQGLVERRKTPDLLRLRRRRKIAASHGVLTRGMLNTPGMLDGICEADVLEDKCTVAHIKRVNKANGFHSFIKERLHAARGVATIYLNRYNALFSQVFGEQDAAADKIYALMTNRNGMFADIATVKNDRFLIL